MRSPTYIDEALIEAIGLKLKDQIVPSVSPTDASAWEAWCYRAVLASHAHSDFMQPPDENSFLKEWLLTLDEWAGDRGIQLRDRASLFTSMTKVIPGNAAHLLAYPVARSDSPENA